MEKQRTERIMASLDGLKKAEAPGFFYTKLIGRMQHEQEPVRISFFLLRPAFVTAALSIVLIVNLVSLMKLDKQPAQKAAVELNKPATIESFAEAYNMNTGSVYE